MTTVFETLGTSRRRICVWPSYFQQGMTYITTNYNHKILLCMPFYLTLYIIYSILFYELLRHTSFTVRYIKQRMIFPCSIFCLKSHIKKILNFYCEYLCNTYQSPPKISLCSMFFKTIQKRNMSLSIAIK